MYVDVMRCERCQGTGIYMLWPKPPHTPCPVCQGSGITYCCDEAGANQPNTRKIDGLDRILDHEGNQDRRTPQGDAEQDQGC